VPLVMKYFLTIQVLGFVLLMVYSILLTAIINGQLNVRLKDFVQLRFIFVYFFFIHTVIFIGGIALRLYKLYNKEKDAKHLAEKSFLSAQLQMLRQQLNPHFLFNNLNIIASTINNNPKLAYDFTKSMASFYRKVLETENAGWILLRDELKTIQSYLYMLGVRFEDKLVFTIDVPDEVQYQFSVPDFILQPIVENAVKHNTCSKASPLRIIISIDDKGSLLIKNNYQPKGMSSESIGIGWFNIENRYKYLEAKAPVKYIKDGWFYVEVWLLKNSNT
jgi:two-component system, LytTR family, sensor kinase